MHAEAAMMNESGSMMLRHRAGLSALLGPLLQQACLFICLVAPLPAHSKGFNIDYQGRSKVWQEIFSFCLVAKKKRQFLY